jgi:hypothetical protein
MPFLMLLTARGPKQAGHRHRGRDACTRDPSTMFAGLQDIAEPTAQIVTDLQKQGRQTVFSIVNNPDP